MNHFTLYKPEWKYTYYSDDYLGVKSPKYRIGWKMSGTGIPLTTHMIQRCKEIGVDINAHSGTFEIVKSKLIPYSDVIQVRIKEAVDMLKDTLDVVALLFQEFDKDETVLNEKLKEMEDLKPYIKELVDGITEYK